MPQPVRWTAELKRRFIVKLGRLRNASAAARACGLSRRSAYQLRERDPAFARDWDAVLLQTGAASSTSFDRFLSELDQAPRGSNEARFAELLRRVRNGGG